MSQTVIDQLLPSGFYRDRTRNPWCIVLHYTAGYTAQQCYDILKKRNLGVHLCIDRDGTTYRFVNDGDRAWHVGYGSWCGMSELNNHSLGIEIVNFGWTDGIYVPKTGDSIYRNPSKTNPELQTGTPEFYRNETSGGKILKVLTKQGSTSHSDHRSNWKNKLWADYPSTQIDAVSNAVWTWMDKYSILPENIIGHEHADPARKSDPGPALPWKTINSFLDEKVRTNQNLSNPQYNPQLRWKAVQAHLARLELPVGDIDGFTGPKTESCIKKAFDLYGATYGLDIKVSGSQAICNELKKIPGF